MSNANPNAETNHQYGDFSKSDEYSKKAAMTEPRVIFSSDEPMSGADSPTDPKRSDLMAKSGGHSSQEGIYQPQGRKSPSKSVQQPDDGLTPLPMRSSVVGQPQTQQEEQTMSTLPSTQPEESMDIPVPDEPVLDAVLTQDIEQQRQSMLDNAVTAVDVRPDVPKESNPRRKWITIGVVLLVVVGAAVGTTLGIVLGRDDDDSSGSDTSNPTAMPTTTPSVSPTEAPTSFVFSQVAALVEAAFGTAKPLEDSTSPQYRAADWMAHVDTLLDLSTVTTERFMQRYAVVVFYFATGGDVTWTTQANFLLPDTHECLWSELVPEGQLTITGSFGVASCTPDLEVLIIEFFENGLSGFIPPEISAFSNMDFLILNQNNIGGTLPPSLFDLSTLQVLWVPFNDLVGTIPTEIGNLSIMNLLWIQETSLSGTIPTEIGNLVSLQALTLANNEFLTGTVPDTLLQLSVLQSFDVNSNDLSGPFPLAFPSSWPSLSQINLNLNGLTGMLPSDLGSLALLETFSIQLNNFSGPFPQSFANLNLLTLVDFSDNSLSGELPDMSLLSNLELAAFQDNLLSGPLPPSFGSLPNITVVDFSGNSFSGPIPSEFGNLPDALSVILFIDNDLTGTVPEFFTQFSNLQALGFNFNQLEGDISFFCDDMDEIILPFVTFLSADCLEEVICPCCTTCCDTNDDCINQ